MLVKVKSVCFQGIDVHEVDVEVHVSARGLPTFEIIGLADRSISESKLRLRSALQMSGIHFPQKKLVVNLAPADLHKVGSCYDLPIAAGILSITQDLELPDRALFFGEVSLDGSLRGTNGVFSTILFAKEHGYTRVFLPRASMYAPVGISHIDIIEVFSLNHLAELLKKKVFVPAKIQKNAQVFNNKALPNIYVLQGQPMLKRALQISAAGCHNLFMLGPPGVGKTMSARLFGELQSDLTEEEFMEVNKIYSSCGRSNDLLYKRPFRMPHHTTTLSGLIGGGNIPSPGEITLAHRGVLFLDELSEFKKEVLESLRQPLEDGYIKMARSRRTYTFPSKFTLIAASNPCPCGYYGSSLHVCKCTLNMVRMYQRKLSGPLLDRMDLHVSVPDVDTDDLGSIPKVCSPANDLYWEAILYARKVQSERYKTVSFKSNGDIESRHIFSYCPMDKDATLFLRKCAKQFGLSARAYCKILKVSRTISDLSRSSVITTDHISEAVQYRTKLLS